MQALKFKNFTTEDFTWKFDGIPYTFKAGQEMFLEDYKAYHFAKHLVDREMNQLGIETNNQSERARLGAKCFPSDEAITPLEALNINEEEKAEKKSAKKVVSKKKVEAEFEELDEN